MKNEKKKKILFVTQSLGCGGMERVLVSMANVLVEKNFDVTILCYDPRDDLKVFLHPGVHYVYKPRREFKILRKIPYIHRFYNLKKAKWEHRASATELYRYYVGKEKYDVEIGFYRGPSIKIISGSKNKHSKKLAWVHTDFKLCNEKSVLLWFNSVDEVKSAYGKMDNIVCVSAKATESFVEKIGHSDKAITVYNMIPTAEIIEKSKDECPLEKKKFTFVTVGRLITDKRYDRLLKATKRLRDEGFDFDVWIVGYGALEDELKLYCRENNLDNVFFTGKQENPYVYMKNADMFVLTSQREGFALVVPEAMTCGLPVLSTKCTGPVEILQNGEYGILVENSSEGVYKGLKNVLFDMSQLEHYTKKSNERYIDFDEKKIVNEIIELF